MTIVATNYVDPTTGGVRIVIGDRKLHIGTLALDSSYPTGGYPVTASMFGFGTQLDSVMFNQDPAGNRNITYDRANKKIKVFTALGTEASNTSDQSAITAIPYHAIGK